MKKHIIQFFASAILSASAFAYYEPTGTCLTWFGYNALDMASGDYSAFFGSYSGKYGSALDYSSFVGVMSGAYASNLKSCNAIGYYAMSSAYDSDYIMAFGPHAGQDSYYNRDCVFIGRNAGREVYNCTNCVFIGKDAGSSHTGLNECVDIGGLIRIIRYGSESRFEVRLKGNEDPVLSFSDLSGFKCGNFNFYNNDTADIVRANVGQGISYASADGYGPYISLLLENGCLTVCTNGYEAATFEPKRTTPPKSLEIEDEDTGEKYIIKVKSGALKLYKVEETEE